MTKEELAAQLTGHEIGKEISKALAAEAKQARLVVVFGASDDLLEMRGAWEEEYEAWGGTSLLLTKAGVWDEEVCASKCQHYQDAYEDAKAHGYLLNALWDVEGYSWMYQTKIPHATFEIVEEGEPYCRGIVFALTDLVPQTP